MSDDYRNDEFSFMSEHRQYLQDTEKEKQLEEERAREKARLEKEARLKAQREQNKAPAVHPPYGKPYKTDRKIKAPVKKQAQKPQSPPPVKKPLSEEEIKRRKELERRKAAQRKANEERLRRQKAEEQRKREELKRKKAEEKRRYKVANKETAKTRRSAFLNAMSAFLVVVLISGAVLFGISYLIFRLSFASNGSDDVDGYTYTVNGEEKYIKSDISFRGGTVYICADDIANMCNLTVAGDKNEIKYISPGIGNETASFIVGTRRAFVNKTEIRLCADTFVENERFYVPLEFFENYMYGISIAHDEIQRTVAVTKVIINQTDVSVLGAAAKYADITYKIKPADVILSLDENALDEAVGNFNYKINIEEYAQYINPKSLFEYTDVINSSNPADGEYLFTDLISAPKKSDRVSGEIQLRECAAKALEAMLLEANENGLSRIYVFRGYVTDSELSENAKDKEYTSLYGKTEYDEHRLGLTAELYYKYRDMSFEEAESFRWLRENAHKFGFVLRYPKDKESRTGVDYRPWSFRFVGRYNAVKMYEENLCLEEYVQKYLDR